jgi:hypothetical protein
MKNTELESNRIKKRYNTFVQNILFVTLGKIAGLFGVGFFVAKLLDGLSKISLNNTKINGRFSPKLTSRLLDQSVPII